MVTSSEFNRAVNKLDSIARDIHSLAKVMQSMDNTAARLASSVEIMIKELTKDVDLDKLSKDAVKIGTIGQQIDENRNFFARYASELDPNPPQLIPRKLEIDQKIRVVDAEHMFFGHTGKIERLTSDGSFIRFDGKEKPNGTPFQRNQFVVLDPPAGKLVNEFQNIDIKKNFDINYNKTLEIKEVAAPQEIHPDAQGRLFPHQWRYNFGWPTIDVALREKHRTHENYPMTEEAFRIYNAGLFAEKVVDDTKKEIN